MSSIKEWWDSLTKTTPSPYIEAYNNEDYYNSSYDSYGSTSETQIIIYVAIIGGIILAGVVICSCLICMIRGCVSI